MVYTNKAVGARPTAFIILLNQSPLFKTEMIGRLTPVTLIFYLSTRVQPLGMPLAPSGQLAPLAALKVPVAATPSSQLGVP